MRPARSLAIPSQDLGVSPNPNTPSGSVTYGGIRGGSYGLDLEGLSTTFDM